MTKKMTDKASNLASTLVDSATPARQVAAVMGVNAVAWLPDTDELLKIFAIVTAIAVLLVQLMTVYIKGLEIRRLKRDMQDAR